MAEALGRLRAEGFQNAFVFVLRENEGARRFYARHGFAWDGTRALVPFPHDTVCVGLPDSLLGSAWPTMQTAFGVPSS